MKLLPKQSKCPHCQTVYRYGDLKKLMKDKKTTCYHCKKKVKVSKKSFLILAAELIVVYAAVNIFSMLLIKSLSFPMLFIINLIPTAAAALIMPLYLELTKPNE